MASINYYLRENKLKDGAVPSYAAWVVTKSTVQQQDLINLMAASNTTVSRQDIIVVMDLLKEVIVRQLHLGNRISTDLFRASLSMKGIFEAKTAEFDPNIHSLRVNMNAPASLQKDLQHNASVAKTSRKIAVPDLVELFDAATESSNAFLTPGGAAELRGSRLALDTADENQGIFLKHETEDISLRVDRYHIATGTRIFFTVPSELPQGNYILGLRNLRGQQVQEEIFPALLHAA